ncbi:MAG: hypothetical protein NUV98_02785 [Candidatus Roizmanbacteria bacterium]|nr:hypothetical protein [Candidatus Roizmanbacteria bacterium]
MHNNHLLMNLQDRFKKGGYVLVAPKSGRVYAYGEDIEKMYEKIIKDKIPSTNKHIMFIPRADRQYVF